MDQSWTNNFSFGSVESPNVEDIFQHFVAEATAETKVGWNQNKTFNYEVFPQNGKNYLGKLHKRSTKVRKFYWQYPYK